MIGLLATFSVVAYLLVPSGLFRSFYSLFVPHIKFQRTRAEEFTFAVLASVLPFFLAVVLVWTAANWPCQIRQAASDSWEAYRIFTSAAINEKIPGEGQNLAYWAATNQVIRRQARFLICYYAFVLLEAWIFAWLTRNYGRWSGSLPGLRGKLYLWTATKILLPALNEWHVLLTPFSYPPEPVREVWVDVLTSLDVLYKGHVLNFFLDKDGQLSGIFLEYPWRFDRHGLLREIAKGNAKPDTDSYWTKIPSNKLYVPNEKIVNLNVRYLTEDEATALQASWILGEGFDVASGE
jgi:hypothetical protein